MSKVIFDKEIRELAKEHDGALFAAAFESPAGAKIQSFSFGMKKDDASNLIRFCLLVSRGDDPTLVFNQIYRKQAKKAVKKASKR